MTSHARPEAMAASNCLSVRRRASVASPVGRGVRGEVLLAKDPLQALLQVVASIDPMVSSNGPRCLSRI